MITEQLTKWRGQLLRKCISDIKKDKWGFTNKGNVLVRFEGEAVPIQIRNEKDIMRFIEAWNKAPTKNLCDMASQLQIYQNQDIFVQIHY